MNNRLFDKLFRDSSGEIVIAQMPNLPIVIWAVASLLKIVYKTGRINLGLDILAFVSLFIWAIQELFQGVNYFRRGLGAIVIIALIATKIH
jgi:predicted neutral ceramidase superfamily lipid hydrolase